jgi:hypothetical protein
MKGIRITDDDDLRDLAMACRVALAQAERDRDAQSSPTVRAQLDANVRRYRDLAERLDRARAVTAPSDRRSPHTPRS